MHLGAQTGTPDEEPIDGIILRTLGQKVGSSVVPSKFLSRLGVAIAPAKIPGLLTRLQIHPILWHIQCFIYVLESCLIWQKLALPYVLLLLGLGINITEVPVVE